MPTQVLKDVPAEDVEQVVADFEAQGATVTKTQQPDGKFTVTAVFP
jgi:hypothetical protein